MTKGIKARRRKRPETPTPYLEGMSLEERINTASARTRERNRKRMERYEHGRAMNNMDLRTVWDKNSPDGSQPLSFGEGEIVRYAWKRHIKLRGDKPPFLSMMKWSLQMWPQIMGGQFASMPNPPELPAPRFFSKCLSQFFEAYEARDRMEKYASMTTREQLIDKLVRLRGKDKEAAEREVDERLGLTKLKREIEDERIKLQRLQNKSDEHNATKSRIATLERTARRKESARSKEVAKEFDSWV